METINKIVEDSNKKSEMIKWEVISLVAPVFLIFLIIAEYNFPLGLLAYFVTFLLSQIVIELKYIRPT